MMLGLTEFSFLVEQEHSIMHVDNRLFIPPPSLGAYLSPSCSAVNVMFQQCNGVRAHKITLKL